MLKIADEDDDDDQDECDTTNEYDDVEKEKEEVDYDDREEDAKVAGQRIEFENYSETQGKRKAARRSERQGETEQRTRGGKIAFLHL
uniref:Uncharacterized protein n=1 Tax=Octopus bimaculoides TaxID=37653 RepID=A0A0L8IB17_OCTBM